MVTGTVNELMFRCDSLIANTSHKLTRCCWYSSVKWPIDRALKITVAKRTDQTRQLL